MLVQDFFNQRIILFLLLQKLSNSNQRFKQMSTKRSFKVEAASYFLGCKKTWSVTVKNRIGPDF